MAGKFLNIFKRLQPRTGRIISESGAVVNSADIARRISTAIDPFGAVRVTEYQPVFSSRPLAVSVIYDRTFLSGSSSISVVDGEYKLTNPGGETCRLETSQRGRYQSGLVGVPGVGARRTTVPTGTTTYWMGYFDSNDGFGFKEDSNGLHTFVRRNGTEVYSNPRSKWFDPLDGTGPSGKKIDLLDGKIVRLPFLWYGYGSLTMAIIVPANNLEEDDEVIPIDRFRPTEQTSLVNPNLPISVEITGDSAGEIFVGGRQYGVFGNLDLRRRIIGEIRTGQSIADTDGFVPAISARVRPTDPWNTVPVQMAGLDLTTDANLDWYILVGGNLTSGGSALTSGDWNISQFSNGDTSCEFNTTADAVTGGEIIGGPGLATSSGGNKVGSESANIPNQDIPLGEPVTVMVKSQSGTANIRTTQRMAELR